jgi:CBS domain-containing protein
MTGVVTKTDIVTSIRHNPGSALEAPVKTIMASDVVYCRVADPLVDVWRIMQKRGFQRIPIVDDVRTPVGVVHIRDVLQRLFCEAEVEDELLRNYISGVGYQ